MIEFWWVELLETTISENHGFSHFSVRMLEILVLQALIHTGLPGRCPTVILRHIEN